MELFYYLYCTALCEGALHVHCANCISVSAIELSIINTSGNSWESDLGVHSKKLTSQKPSKYNDKRNKEVRNFTKKSIFYWKKNTHTLTSFILLTE